MKENTMKNVRNAPDDVPHLADGSGAAKKGKKTDDGNAVAIRLCDELIQAAYDAEICSPGDLAYRVRKIKAALAKS